MSQRVMIVEDEALVALTLEDVLLDAGYTVVGIADRPAEALVLARAERPDIAVVDVRLAEGGDGILLAEQLALLGPTLILFATGNPGEVRSRARIGHGCISKPFQTDWLLAALRAVQSPEDGKWDQDVPNFFRLPLKSEP